MSNKKVRKCHIKSEIHSEKCTDPWENEIFLSHFNDLENYNFNVTGYDSAEKTYS